MRQAGKRLSDSPKRWLEIFTHHSVVLEGLRGEVSIAELYRSY